MNNSYPRLVSPDETIARLYTDFGVSEPSITDFVFEWIGDTLKRTRIPLPARPKEVLQKAVKKHKVLIPCDYDSGLEIEYYPNNDTDNTPVQIYPHTGTHKGNKQGQINEAEEIFYWLTDNNINFSFETGTVNLYYKALPLSDCGLPLIPDEQHFMEGTMFWIMHKLLLRGYKHPTLNNWREARALAQEELRMSTIVQKSPGKDQLMTFKRSWSDMFTAFRGRYRPQGIPNRLLPDTTFDT